MPKGIKGFQKGNKTIHTLEGRIRIGLATSIRQMGKSHYQSTETKKRISEGQKKVGVGKWNKGKFLGSNNPNWKGGINRDFHSTKEPQYREWRTKCFERDSWKCKIEDSDCKGQLQVHHILRWADYPELRYEIKNGITLCMAHHPRKKSKELELSPYFTSLILKK